MLVYSWRCIHFSVVISLSEAFTAVYVVFLSENLEATRDVKVSCIFLFVTQDSHHSVIYCLLEGEHSTKDQEFQPGFCGALRLRH